MDESSVTTLCRLRDGRWKEKHGDGENKEERKLLEQRLQLNRPMRARHRSMGIMACIGS